MFGVKLGLATVAAFVALVATVSAHASTPIPWCGTSSSAIDRLPDATSAYAVHVAYVRPASAPDRFAALAPRIVGDTAAFDTWWRREDATRTPRFDLFPASGCATSFGALDISNVQLPRTVSEHQQRLPGAPPAAVVRARLQRAREGLSRLLRRPDRPGRRGSRLRAGSARERLRPSRLRGRLPRLLRRRRGRLAQARGGGARAGARLRRGRSGCAELLQERPRLRLRARSHDRRPHR